MRSCITLAAISDAEINFPLGQLPHMANHYARNLTSTVFSFDCVSTGLESGYFQIPISGIVTFIGVAAQAKPARFEGARASVLDTLPFGFNPGDARDWSLASL